MPKRCGWVKMNNPLYVAYHDEEWGRPLHDDQALFELLCLETYQAGLSWETVLTLSLIHNTQPTRRITRSRNTSSA